MQEFYRDIEMALAVPGIANAAVEIYREDKLTKELAQDSMRKLAWVLVEVLSVGNVILLLVELQRAIQMEAARLLMDEAEAQNKSLYLLIRPGSGSVEYSMGPEGDEGDRGDAAGDMYEIDNADYDDEEYEDEG
jgi:hypothetical protein